MRSVPCAKLEQTELVCSAHRCGTHSGLIYIITFSFKYEAIALDNVLYSQHLYIKTNLNSDG